MQILVSLVSKSQEFISDIARGCFLVVLYGIEGCLELVLYGIRDHFLHLKVSGHIALPAILCHKDPAQGARMYCTACCLVP